MRSRNRIRPAGTLLCLAGLVALTFGSVGAGVAATRAEASPTVTELEVVEQGFRPHEGFVRWGVLVRNPNLDTWVGSGTVEVTFSDGAGDVVGTDSWPIFHIDPMQVVAVGRSLGPLAGEPTTMTVLLTTDGWIDGAELSPGNVTATIVSDDLTATGDRRVVAAIRSTLTTDAEVTSKFVLRNTSGALLGVESLIVGVPAGTEVGAEWVFFNEPELSSGTSVDVDADWFATYGAATNPDADVLALEVVEVGGGWYEGLSGKEASWGALIRNPNGEGWVSQTIFVTATFRDSAGQITGADYTHINSVLPGQTLGVGTNLTLAPESRDIEVTVTAEFWTQVEVAPEQEVTFDDVAKQDENGEFSGVTAVMTVPEEQVGKAQINVGVVYRDAAGQIVGGRSWFESPETATSSIEIREFTHVPNVVSVELSASYFVDAEPLPLAPSGDPGQFRPGGTFSPEVATHIPAPTDVSTDPPVVFANLILAALAVLALTIGVRLLNTTLVAHEDALEGFLRPARALGTLWERADSSLAGHVGRAAEVVRVGGVLLFYGVLFSFLEPGWRPWTLSGLFVLAVMTVAFGAVGTGDDLVELRSARRWGLPARLAVKPALVLFAVGSVVLTKFAGLVPGLMIGTPEAFSLEEKGSERDETRLAAVGLGSTAAIGLAAWALSAPLDGMLDGTGGVGQGAISALVTVLVLIFAVTVENLFASLLAFPGSKGSALRRRSRVGWWTAMIAITALFFHTLINPAGDLGESLRSTNVRVVLITVASFLVFTIVVWWWFRRRDQQQPPAVARPTADESEVLAANS